MQELNYEETSKLLNRQQALLKSSLRSQNNENPVIKAGGMGINLVKLNLTKI